MTSPAAPATPKQRTTPPANPAPFGPPTTGGRSVSLRVPVKALKRLAIMAGVAVGGLLLIGIGAQTGSHTEQPDSGTLAVLHYASQHSTTPCYAVWSVGAKTWAVKCGQLH